jgi:hypothetical protein
LNDLAKWEKLKPKPKPTTGEGKGKGKEEQTPCKCTPTKDALYSNPVQGKTPKCPTTLAFLSTSFALSPFLSANLFPVPVYSRSTAE